jgi:hypothetical protein
MKGIAVAPSRTTAGRSWSDKGIAAAPGRATVGRSWSDEGRDGRAELDDGGALMVG